MNPQLIFIFSLPRSGSTWLQRIISSHPEVATCAEPWLLLPVISATKAHYSIQPYEHDLCLMGIEDALSSTHSDKHWKETYFSGVNAMAHKIYAELADGKPFFLDKTPRYALICEEIMQAFPEAKFIFLWRHPFSIVSSIQQTWSKSDWTMPRYHIDLYDGLFNLISTCNKYKENIFSVQYEEIALNPERELKALFSYLELDFDISFTENAKSNNIQGVMGDPNQFINNGGLANTDYDSACTQFCSNKFRKRWLTKYIKFIGPERLSFMGYDFSEALDIINKTKPKCYGFKNWLNNSLFYIQSRLLFYLEKNNLGREAIHHRYLKSLSKTKI